MQGRTNRPSKHLVVPTDERRAAHEAGHVLTAVAVGWPFDYVTIDRDPRYPDLHGHVKYSRRIDETASFGDLRACIAAFLGGKYGELALIGNVGPGPAQDEKTVIQLINDYYAPDDRSSVYREAAMFADAVLRDSVQAARVIRDALVSQRRITGSSAEQLVRQHAGPEVRLVIQERDVSL